MFCHNCDKKIAEGDGYYKYSGKPFCSPDCVTDNMIYNGRLTIETNNGENEEDD